MAGPDAKFRGSCGPALPDLQWGRGQVNACGASRCRDLSGMWKTHPKSTRMAVMLAIGEGCPVQDAGALPLPRRSGLSPADEGRALPPPALLPGTRRPLQLEAHDGAAR